MSDLELQLRNYRLTTAEILYRLPDHPGLLQTFTWQFLDLAPDYPRLVRFLDFWEESIEGRIHSVQVMNSAVVAPAELRYHSGALHLH